VIAFSLKSPFKHPEAEAIVVYSPLFEGFMDRLDFLPKRM
jgi:hypothetical protein